MAQTTSRQISALAKSFEGACEGIHIAFDGYLIFWPNDDALDDAMNVCKRICPKVSTEVFRKGLMSLAEELFLGRELPVGEIPKEIVHATLKDCALHGKLEERIEEWQRMVHRWTVVFPILSLEIFRSELKVGPVSFRPRESDDRLCEEIYEHVSEQQLGLLQRFEAVIAENNVETYALCTVEADSSLAKEESYTQVQHALAILSLLVVGASAEHYRRMGIIGSRTGGIKSISMYSVSAAMQNEREPYLSQSYTRREVLPVQITADEQKRLEESGLVTLLANSFLVNSECDRRLARAVSWYAKGADAESDEEAYVCLAIALEALLVGDEGRTPLSSTGSISQRLGDRVAFLRGRDVSQRVDIEKQTKTLYGLRSGIVHEGKSVNRDELREFDQTVRDSIVTFARKEFGNWQDFLAWEREEKFWPKPA
jgi:hypothetical protein